MRRKAPRRGASIQGGTYANDPGAFSIELPDGFEIKKENGTIVYIQGEDRTTLLAWYEVCDMDIPIYSCDDIGDNREHCAEYLCDSFDASDCHMNDGAYTSVNGRRAYRADWSMQLDGEEASCFLIGIDAPVFGCYMLFGLYYPDNARAAENLEKCAYSLNSTGTPIKDLALFESDELGLRAMYPYYVCEGGTEIVYGRQSEGLVDCAYFYKDAGAPDMNYVELERAVYGSTPQKALDALHKHVKESFKVLDASEQTEKDVGLNHWLIRDYAVMMDDGGTAYLSMATAEVDAEVIAVGLIANEEGYDDTAKIFSYIVRSVQPYDASQDLL